MDNGIEDHIRAQISPGNAVAEVAKVLWHLRSILGILLVLFLFGRL